MNGNIQIMRNKEMIASCIWFALLMGAPYSFLSGSSFVMLPFGAEALSATYAWVALGFIAGLWISSHHSVRVHLVWETPIVRLVLIITILISVLLICSAWMNTVVLLGLMGQEDAWREQDLIECKFLFSDAVLFVLHHSNTFALLGAMGCGVLNNMGYKRNVVLTESLTKKHVKTVVVVVSCMVGALQPLAWLELLPHPIYPQSITQYVLNNSYMWEIATGITYTLLPVPTILMIVLSGLSRFTTQVNFTVKNTQVICWSPVVYACVGLLAFRFVSRIVPSIVVVNEKLAYGALTLYLVLLLVLVVYLVDTVVHVQNNRERATSGQTEDDHDCNWTVATLPEILTEKGRDFVSEKKLSDREVLVLCAQIAGLTAEQTGSIVGIKESTVREYRRRSRIKLGMNASDDVREKLPAGLLVERDAKDNNTEVHTSEEMEGADTRRNGVQACLCVLAVLGLFMFLPMGGVIRTWSDVWTSSFGIGIGFLLVWFALYSWNGNMTAFLVSRRTSMISCIVLGLVFSVVLLLAYRNGIVFSNIREEFNNIIVLLSFSIYTFCYSLLVKYAVATNGKLNTILSQATEPNDMVRDDTSRSLAQLAIFMFVGWFWAETWRAQQYVSLLAPLEVGIATLVLVEIYRCGIYRPGKLWMLAGLVAICIVVGLAKDVGCALAIGTALLLALDDAMMHVHAEVDYAWHSGYIAIAIGLIGGTLATNAFGSKLLYAGVVQKTLVQTETAWAVGALFVCAVVAYGYRSIRLTNIELGTDRRVAVESYLSYRGLSDNQINIALYLAEGKSVRDTANLMGYAESTVHSARSEIYGRLGVKSRMQLIELIKIQLDSVDAQR